MKKIIAQCNTNPNDQQDLTYLKQKLPEYDVLYGAEALELIQTGKIEPKNVLVVQECNAKIARKLRKKGAIPFLNYCFESQIYAYIFYSKLKRIAPKFRYRLYFKGMFDELKNCDKQNNFEVHYPGITEFEPEQRNWNDRDFVAMVIRNKYVEQNNVFPKSALRVDRYIKWVIRLFFETKTQRFLKEKELQNKRLEVIEYFGGKNELKMYGRGWNNLNEIPKHWQKRLQNIIKKLNPKPIENKLEAISRCKFNFAIENLSYKGYITEKILESLVAKTIPVYLGAPDIENYIPKGCFIDMRDFKDLDDLYSYMKNMKEEEAQKYFDCAKAFLESDEAKKYTEEGFSNLLAKLVKSNDEKREI